MKLVVFIVILCLAFGALCLIFNPFDQNGSKDSGVDLIHDSSLKPSLKDSNTTKNIGSMKTILIKTDNILFNGKKLSFNQLRSDLLKAEETTSIYLVDHWAILQVYDDVNDLLTEYGYEIIHICAYQ